jgi:hypothetical protein
VLERGLIQAAALLLGGGIALYAQAPLTAPAPLAAAPAPVSPAQVTEMLEAAQRAHDFGQLSAAAKLYRQLLAAPGADRVVLTLALASVQLDAGEPAQAQQTLAALPEPRPAAWHLRAGLAALYRRRRDVAQAEWDATRVDELPEADRAWHLFLQGALYDTLPTPDVTKANELYNQAKAAAKSELARAHFQNAAERVRLRRDAPSNEEMEQTRRSYEQNAGRTPGYQAAKNYAVMLSRRDRKSEAVQFLQSVLVTIPNQDRGWRDEFQIMVGLIGDHGRTREARAALSQLLATGTKPDVQRQGLQLLADASQAEPERGQFRAELNRLIAATPPHLIKESLLYFRAQLALADRDHPAAERDANQLIRDYPGSPLRVHAFGVLTQSAWEQGRYRLAADNASKAREALPVGPNTAGARGDLGVLEAEAWYRAGDQAEHVDRNTAASRVDYRRAADAYAAVLRERSGALEPRKLAGLMYQRVVAEIKAGAPDAAKVLDELAGDPAFDLENRWKAEWSLAQALKVQGAIDTALARVTRLLAETGEAAARLQPELRARMAWLQARLAFDAGQYEQALALSERLLGALGEVEQRLRGEIASIVVLLKARAEFALGREPAAVVTLQKLREEHPDTDAAIYSYLIEAAHYENKGKIVDAQVQLTKLTDNQKYKASKYFPLALYQLALLSEQLGRKENLQEAVKQIEAIITIANATGENEGELVFAARMKQADLFRRLSDFPSARRGYEELVNKYPRRPDVVFAQLALAQTLNAQSAADDKDKQAGTNAAIARLKFEELRDRVDAPPDVRVEAGYNLGKLLEREGKVEEAMVVWWNLNKDPALKTEVGQMENTAKRPYWLGRTLLDLGELQEQQLKLEEAKESYLLVLRKKLPGESIARKALERLGVPTANL